MKVVILAGGSGTRLWPLSRKDMPKQFIKLIDSRYSLLQQTIIRNQLDGAEILLITGESYEHLCKQQLKEIGVSGTILTEPCPRNTAPAIALVLNYLNEIGTSPEEPVLFVPADHIITPESAYQRAILKGANIAVQKGGIVTFGIKPSHPATGYGYIKADIASHENANSIAFDVSSFVEKPDKTKALRYLKSGDYFWNSGMFLFTLASGYKHFEIFTPEIFTRMESPHTVFKSEFETIPGISFDYAIMEKAESVSVIPLNVQWSDVGSWSSLYEVCSDSMDSQGNIHPGTKTCLLDTRNTYIQSENRVVTAIGVQDLAIIDTPDALLVANRKNDQKIREIVKQIEKDDTTRHVVESSTTSARPWGSFTVLADQKDYKLKEITVNPGQRLSLQRHQHRSENWTVIQGLAHVTIGDEEHPVKEGESVFIPVGTVHRLTNKTENPVRIIELQTGTYFGEDDIERLEDEYGRC